MEQYRDAQRVSLVPCGAGPWLGNNNETGLGLGWDWDGDKRQSSYELGSVLLLVMLQAF